MPRAKEPRSASFLRVTLGGRESIGVFREISGFSSQTEVTELEEVDEKGRRVIRRVPGALKSGNIMLKRGVDTNRALWEWRRQAEEEGPDKARADGVIELLDSEGGVIAGYKFRQGWPIKYEGLTLDAASNDVAIETVEIAHEGFERT